MRDAFVEFFLDELKKLATTKWKKKWQEGELSSHQKYRLLRGGGANSSITPRAVEGKGGVTEPREPMFGHLTRALKDSSWRGLPGYSGRITKLQTKLKDKTPWDKAKSMKKLKREIAGTRKGPLP